MTSSVTPTRHRWRSVNSVPKGRGGPVDAQILRGPCRQTYSGVVFPHGAAPPLLDRRTAHDAGRAEARGAVGCVSSGRGRHKSTPKTCGTCPLPRLCVSCHVYVYHVVPKVAPGSTPPSPLTAKPGAERLLGSTPICGCPMEGTFLRIPAGMAPRKGTKAPGISPCPLGSRRTGRRLERPPPSGHTGPASVCDALGGDLAPPEMRVEGYGVGSGVCACCAKLVEAFCTGTWRDLLRTLPTLSRERSPQTRPAPRGGNLIHRRVRGWARMCYWG
jgi:hypothetical protein